MGLLDWAFGDLRDALTKKKTPPPEPAKGSVKNVTNVVPQKTVVQREVLPRPVAIPQANPVLIQMPQMQNMNPVSLEDLKAASDWLDSMSKKNQVEYPNFDISDLKEKLPKAITEDDLPLDLSGLANVSDVLYGTNLAANTPNLRARKLSELKDLRSLNADSQALQQVKGQARLAEFKAKLDQWAKAEGEMSPLQRSEMVLNLAKAFRGGVSPDALTRMQLGIQEKNAKAAADAAEENRRTQADQRKKLNDLQDEWRKDPDVVNYKDTQARVNNLRDSLNSPSTGTSDYESVITFVKGLDPHSAVMYNEAQSFYKAASIVDQILNAPNVWANGGKLTAPQRDIMSKIMTRMERRSKERYDAARRGKAEEAASQGIEPAAVLKPVDKTVKVPEGDYLFRPSDGSDDYIIPGNQIDRFKEDMKKKGIQITPMGRVGGSH